MRAHAEVHDEPPAPGARHETRDISTRVVVVFAASLVVGAILVYVAVWALFGYYGSLRARSDTREYPLAQVGADRPLPPEPRLQVTPREDLKVMRAEEQKVLDTYGWVDPASGTVRIPIDRAMQLLLQQGLPARAQAPAGASPGMPQSSSSGRTAAPYERY
jgi:hypothetical protein